MSRSVVVAAVLCAWPTISAAQQTASDANGAETISAEEALAESESYAGPPLPPECEPDPINNTIVICAPRDDAQFRVQEGFDWRTIDMKGDTPRAPDTFGIPNHGIAIPFGSVPEPVLIIDLEAIPEAPPGSDADRVARGLAPRGYDDGSGKPVPEVSAD